jgi:hypothetical protein
MVPARRFFAAVSWQGVQATSLAQQKVVPVSGDFMGGEWAEAMARKEMAEFIPYKLYWGCSRWAGRGENPGDSPKFTFSVAFLPGELANRPRPPQNRLCNQPPQRHPSGGRGGGLPNPAKRGF